MGISHWPDVDLKMAHVCIHTHIHSHIGTSIKLLFSTTSLCNNPLPFVMEGANQPQQREPEAMLIFIVQMQVD